MTMTISEKNDRAVLILLRGNESYEVEEKMMEKNATYMPVWILKTDHCLYCMEETTLH